MISKSRTHFKFDFALFRVNILKPRIFLDRIKIGRYKNPILVPTATGDLRIFQLLAFAILLEFKKFADENNLKYWLDFGTLLGSVRHKGFIPWDDDIDLGMMRDDYDRLCQIMPNFNGNIKFVPAFGYRECCFVRIMYKDIPDIFIDIFPYDYFYKKLNSEEKLKESEKITKILTKKSGQIHASNDFNTIREEAKKIRINNVLENKTVDINSKPDIFMGIDFPHLWKNKFYNWEDILPLKTIEFEGKKFPCPNRPEKVLTSIYGNYLEMPKNLSPKHFGCGKLPNEIREKVLDIVEGLK